MKVYLVCFLAIFGVGIVSAEESKFVVYVDVKNGVTHHTMDYVRCHMQVQDSIDGRWGLAQDALANYNHGTITAVFNKRPQDGQYRIYVRKMQTNTSGNAAGYDNRYETGYIPIELPEEAESGYKMPTYYIMLKRPKEKELKEVTVTASKVMFYHKGDTLVYNADAFLLADGSMLDALLNQMPGVELKSNGVILCNGKRVQSLLLNGKDIFNGKFGEMLDNLPAYTVKDIAVYDKRGRISEMMGMQTGDASYVMDVRLKREYAHGLMANIDAGYGTENRYLAKLFALWFSDNVSVSANAIANNLSDDKRAGKNDNVWSSSQMSDGLYSTQGGGLNYLAKGHEDKWEMKGSVDVSHKSTVNSQSSSTEYFTSGNSNMFTYAISDRNTDRLRFSTNHEILCNIGNSTVVKLKPAVSYNDNRNKSNRLTASFNHQIADLNKDSLENLYDKFSTLTDYVINRMAEEEVNRWNDFSASLDATGYFKLKSFNSSGRKNMLTTQFAAAYNTRSEDLFNRYSVNFGNNTEPDELAHRYYRDSPDYHLDTRAKVELTHFFNLWSLRLPIAYQFRYIEEKKDSRAYNIEQLEEYNYRQWPLETLPPDDVLSGILNPQQSYLTLERHYIHSLDFYCDNLSQIYLNRFPGRYVSFILRGGINFTEQTFDFVKVDRECYARKDLTYDVSIDTKFNTNQSNAWQYALRLMAQNAAPNLNAMASWPSRDPLEVHDGATSLRTSNKYGLQLSTNYKGSGSKSHVFYINGSYETRPFYTSLDINQANGVQTLTQTNGKFKASAKFSYDLSMPLRRNSPFSVSNSISGEFRREILNNSYTTGTILEKFKLTWQHKSLRLVAFADGYASQYAVSSYEDKFKTLSLKYGLEGLAKLPYGWDISTDLTFFTRRGYMNAASNRTESVWNLHASKSLLKGSLILALDAYDLLHQISHVTYSQNPQFRTESTRNGVPAYILLHIRYQLHLSPKHH